MPVSHLGLECVFGIKVNESSKDDSDIGQGWEPQFFLDAWKAGDPKKFWFLNLLVLKIGQNSAAVFILQTSNVMLNKTLTISEGRPGKLELYYLFHWIKGSNEYYNTFEITFWVINNGDAVWILADTSARINMAWE